MRTNIDIDDALLETAMRAGPYKTKKDAVEAGLKLLARQAHYREILKWEGRLRWDGDDAEEVAQAQARHRPGHAPADLRACEPEPAAASTAGKRRRARR